VKKTWFMAALVAVSMSVALAPSVSEAKRLGGGRTSGMQRQAPDATPNKGIPAQQQAATPAASPTQTGAAAAGAAAAAPKRNWMGPLAGLAAGLGLAALFSHLGMGEAFSNFIMMALLALVAVVAIRFVMARFAKPKAGGARGFGGLATAGAGAGAGAGPAWSSAESQPVMNRQADSFNAPAVPSTPAPMGSGLNLGPRPVPVPASFDSEGFERTAKMLFIRLQAANDTGDLNDLRSFTTPEMFAEIKLDLQERGGAAQTTDVVSVEAQVIEVVQEGERQIVSVRYHGRIREEQGGPEADFDEVWHLVRFGDQPSWVISGIQQRS
jgi:predicted lipid-binding transport protein (Tim44 family)